MADTDTDAGNDTSKSSGGSMVSLIIAIVLLTLISAGAGFGAGGFLIDTPAPQKPAAKANQADGAKTSGHGTSASGTDTKTDGAGDQEASQAIEIIDLKPVVTNLANPNETWVRIEASIELVSSYSGDKNLLATTIAEDLLMFTRSLSLASLSGSSGIEHYKEDISERARIRSGGAVNQVLLKMLVIE